MNFGDQCRLFLLNSVQRFPNGSKKGVYHSDGFNPTSEYTEEYRKHPLDMRLPYRPNNNRMTNNEDPMKEKSTYR